jgi:hypothetical protein
VAKSFSVSRSFWSAHASSRRFLTLRPSAKGTLVIENSHARELAARTATSLHASRHLYDYCGNAASKTTV